MIKFGVIVLGFCYKCPPIYFLYAKVNFVYFLTQTIEFILLLKLG